MIRRVRWLTFAALLCACLANSPAESPGDGGEPQAGAAPTDAGTAEDGGAGAKPSADAGSAPGMSAMGAAADGGGASPPGSGTTGGGGTGDAGVQPDLSEELFAATSFP